MIAEAFIHSLVIPANCKGICRRDDDLNIPSDHYAGISIYGLSAEWPVLYNCEEVIDIAVAHSSKTYRKRSTDECDSPRVRPQQSRHDPRGRVKYY